jgi:hypothetical protein
MASKIYRPVSRQQYDAPFWEIAPGDKPPASPSVYDDEFDDDSIDSKWAWRNQGGVATIAETLGVEQLNTPSESGTNVRIREQSIASGDQNGWTMSAKIAVPSRPKTNAANFGIFCLNVANGKIIQLSYSPHNGLISLLRWASTTSFSASAFASTPSYGGSPIYLRLVYASSTFSAYWSPDGVNWGHIDDETLAAFLTTKADKFGFALQTGETVFSQWCDVNWFRVTVP